MKKNLQQSAILFLLFLITTIVSKGQEVQMLILAPQNNDILYVTEEIDSVPVLLGMNQQADSTLYKVTVMGGDSSKGKSTTQKFWAVEDPYTLDLPVNIGEYSQVEVSIYYNGKIEVKDRVQVFFQKHNNQIGYVSE